MILQVGKSVGYGNDGPDESQFSFEFSGMTAKKSSSFPRNSILCHPAYVVGFGLHAIARFWASWEAVKGL